MKDTIKIMKEALEKIANVEAGEYDGRELYATTLACSQCEDMIEIAKAALSKVQQKSSGLPDKSKYG